MSQWNQVKGSRALFFVFFAFVCSFGILGMPPESLAEPNAEETGVAVYSVPVPSELEPFASWTIGSVVWQRRNDGARVLTYRLPENLVAPARPPIQLMGVALGGSKFIRLDGTGGTAYCTESPKTVVCLISFEPRGFDLRRQLDFLAQKYADEPARASFQRVAQMFSSQPVGILKITAP